MKKRLVIASTSLPSRLPLFSTVMLWMLLDYTNAVGWVWGVIGTLMALVWGTFLYHTFTEEKFDLNDEAAPAKLRKWADRLEQLQKEQAAKRG